MKTAWWLLVVLLAFMAGWFGRGRVPVAETAPAAARAAVPAANAARDTSRKRWGEKLREQEEPKALLAEIPAKDRGASVEAWLGSYGLGGLDGATVTKFWNLLDVWVAEDSEAAWQWASGLSDAGMRELAMTGIAGSLADSDPQRAFDCLVAHGEFHHGIRDGRLMNLMKGLSQEALKKDPLALVELWEKVPKAGESVDSYAGVSLELDPATDFRTLLDAMRSKLGKDTDRPLFPNGVMKAWTKTDPEAARGYLIEKIAAKENFDDEWSEMGSVLAKAKGQAAADQWTLEMLRELPEGDRGAFFEGSGWMNSPGRIFDLMHAGATEAESAQWIAETVQVSADHEGSAWKIGNILGELPIEKRIEHLKSLRGPKALELIGPVVERWNLTESQVAEIKQAVASP
ncbi:hypothetical protein [Luteolibacter sp. Populi]|uniref:hypothetical protein n=1 Tax=Luteolibacter sp. Populi TaxID=3230487 RepID=UPI00346685BF